MRPCRFQISMQHHLTTMQHHGTQAVLQSYRNLRPLLIKLFPGFLCTHHPTGVCMDMYGPRAYLNYIYIYTLPETNSSPRKKGKLRKGNSSEPTILFQVLLMSVSGRVRYFAYPFHFPVADPCSKIRHQLRIAAELVGSLNGAIHEDTWLGGRWIQSNRLQRHRKWPQSQTRRKKVPPPNHNGFAKYARQWYQGRMDNAWISDWPSMTDPKQCGLLWQNQAQESHVPSSPQPAYKSNICRCDPQSCRRWKISAPMAHELRPNCKSNPEFSAINQRSIRNKHIHFDWIATQR